MSGAANNGTTLNRRASIRSAARSGATSASQRQYSTFEIEVEYISTPNELSSRNSFHNLNINEEEEEEEEDRKRGSGAHTVASLQVRNVQPPPIQRSTRPAPEILYLRPEQYVPLAATVVQPEDPFAQVYRPNLRSLPRGTVLRPPARFGPSSVGQRGIHGASRDQGQVADEYFQSSNALHDETPALSAGSQSDDDEDADEVHSPVECLELHEDDNDDEAGDEQESGDDTRPMDNTGRSEGKTVSIDIQESPELETQETLKRERTRIQQRRVVSRPREIDFKDISNIQPLKRGGYGEIHTAEWSRLRVVLKRSIPEHSEALEQFEQELEILQRVHDYDFIVPFYGVAVDPLTNVKCMVMKHCTNGNLCVFLEKNHESLTWYERYRLSIEITKGLEFLHKAGFHHRDLHSGNILLDDKRTAMICDFGLSRSATKEQTIDIAETVGVASFLAPERFPHKRPVYSAACDIYSLGVIFWHISSGRIPFAKRLREPILLRELMEGHREKIVPGTPSEFRDLIVKCWDVKASERLKVDVVIAILQTLMAKPSEPIHLISTGFVMSGDTISSALPVPPDLDARMASFERASNTLNKMVFDIQDPMMRETVNYIERTRRYFRDQEVPPEPYSHLNPPKTPIYMCPLVGDIAALHYYLSRGGQYYNPINESSVQTGDTALHLACLLLESPMDTIKLLVELGADINLQNLQGYTPVMILVSSNTQYCFEALKFFVMRGARIPAYIQNPITPLNSAQKYALKLVNDSRQIYVNGQDTGSSGLSVNDAIGVGFGAMQSNYRQDRWTPRPQAPLPNNNVIQEHGGRRVDRLFAQGRPLIHVVAAMQEDHRILDCLCEAGLDPAMSFAGETALVAAAAHLRIKNVEWLLHNDLEISTEAGIQRAIKVVRLLHQYPSGALPYSTGHGKQSSSFSTSRVGDPSHRPHDVLDDIRDLGKYSWAGVAYGDADRLSKDMVGPMLSLLEQWAGNRRISKRKEVATKLKVMYGASTDPFASQGGNGGSRESSVSMANTNSDSSPSTQGNNNGKGQPYRQNPGRGGLVNGSLSLRKSQRHVIDQVLNEKRLR